MAGEAQRVLQRKKELLDLANEYGIRGSLGPDRLTDEQYEKQIVRAAARLTLARVERLLEKMGVL